MRNDIIMKIYVGNIAFSSTDDDLRKAFEPFGTVTLAEVVVDRRTARSKGFGFVEMVNDEERKLLSKLSTAPNWEAAAS